MYVDTTLWASLRTASALLVNTGAYAVYNIAAWKLCIASRRGKEKKNNNHAYNWSIHSAGYYVFSLILFVTEHLKLKMDITSG